MKLLEEKSSNPAPSEAYIPPIQVPPTVTWRMEEVWDEGPWWARLSLWLTGRLNTNANLLDIVELRLT
jgi:hypothetical protein